jgi:hypothetical protein
VILRERNELVGVIQAAGLNLGQFDLVDERGSAWVRHVPSDSSFYFRPRISWSPIGVLPPPRGGVQAYRVRWRVANGPSHDRVMCKDWEDVKLQAEAWARELVYVTQTPDFWATYQSSGQFFTGPDQPVDNGPFTTRERAAIEGRIEEVKRQARANPELTEDQISAIGEKLDYLKEAADRVGKKDWRVLLYGAAFGLILNDTVPPHVVQGIITTMITGLGHIFGLGGPPPALPPQA